MLITAFQNPKIKSLKILLKDKTERKKQSVFVAEGVNLVKDIPDNFIVKELFIKESKYQSLSYIEKKLKSEAILVKDEIFDSVSDTLSPSGIIAVIEKPERNELLSGNEDIVVFLDGIKDPGNLGTIIRSAAARGIYSIVAANCAETYSPKVVRASMGGVFFVNVIECNTVEALNILKDYEITALDMGGENIYEYKRTKKIALTVGSEAQGLSEDVKVNAKKILAIPMANSVESLNAAISISIAMFLIK